MSLSNRYFCQIILLGYLISFIKITSGQGCKRGEFRCNDSNDCLNSQLVCNGVQDCPDGSDETINSCSTKPNCSSDPESFNSIDHFQCSYGACISRHLVCDGKPDCSDKSDETAELCQNGKCRTGRLPEFRCDYGACITYGRHCNTINDCIDGSDEAAGACCPSPYKFRCNSGLCIEQNKKCNKIYDCLDRSDETLELCGYNLEEHTGQTCHRDGFRCHDSNDCLNSKFVCNGVQDCPDGSDETSNSCSTKPNCSSDPESFNSYDHFQCSYGACILRHLVCDGKPDCIDKSDETTGLCRNIKCKTGRLGSFRCDSGACISFGKQCNNINDCVDGSDEKDEVCKKKIAKCARTSQFQCNSGKCINQIKKCDKKYDCLDKSDETLELCGYILKEHTDVDQVSCRLDSTPGMKIDIISCGNPDDLSCLDKRNSVPVSTTVLTNCWGISKTFMTCSSDGLWHPYIIDLKSTTNQQKPMKHLCQPSVINSNVCGKRPRYMKDNDSFFQYHFDSKQMRWPWLVGLLKNEKYFCSGTIITSIYILTAGHCIASSQTSTTTTINPLDLKIQLKNTDNTIVNVRVVSLRLHPLFQNAVRPKNDVGLIELKKEILFSRYVYPACIYRSGDLSNLHKSAMVFLRVGGEELHSWKKLSHDYDRSCFSGNRCSTSLSIDDNEFCGISNDSDDDLRTGSSGGPYLINANDDGDEHWTIAGIVSYSVETGCTKPHTVFTDMFRFWCWLDNCIHRKQCQHCV